MSDLIVFTYQSEEEASEALKRLASAKKDNIHEALVSVSDAAVAIRTANGKVKIVQTLEALVKGGRVVSGGLWGILIGLLLGGPLVGALVGMGLRAFGNRKLDLGIDNEFITQVSEALEPSQSALFLLTDDAEPAAINEALGDHRGTLHHTSLSADAAEALATLADQDDIAAALESDED